MNSRGGSRAQEEAVSYHPVLSLPCCRGGPGPAHTTEPPRLGQGSTRGSLIRADRSASLQTVPAGTQLLPGTISGGWKHREAVHSSSCSEPPSPSIQKLLNCITVGQLPLCLHDHVCPVGSGKACAPCICLPCICPFFPISDNKNSQIP